MGLSTRDSGFSGLKPTPITSVIAPGPILTSLPRRVPSRLYKQVNYSMIYADDPIDGSIVGDRRC